MADLNVKVGLDRSGFQTGLAAMENSARAFGNKLSGIVAGSFSFAAIGAGFSRAIEQGDAIQDLANRFGIAASSIQEIGNAASLSGGSVEDVAAAMNKLAKNAGEAIGGNEKLQESFAAIGLSVGDLAGKTPQDLFFALSRAVASGSLGMRDFEIASELAGRGASTLMETLRMGPDVIQATGQAMGVFGDETTEALSKASDAIKTFQNTITLGFAAVVPVIQNLIERYQDLVEAVTLSIQARFNPNLDATAKADLMEQSSLKAGDVVFGRSSLEEKQTQQVVRNTEARIEQYDKEASAKEAAAARMRKLSDKSLDLDAKEEALFESIEFKKQIREAERIRDATPGSKAFEQERSERLRTINQQRGNAPDFDPREALMNRFGLGQQAMTPPALQDPVRNTVVQSISTQLGNAVSRLDTLIQKAGSFI